MARSKKAFFPADILQAKGPEQPPPTAGLRRSSSSLPRLTGSPHLPSSLSSKDLYAPAKWPTGAVTLTRESFSFRLLEQKSGMR